MAHVEFLSRGEAPFPPPGETLEIRGTIKWFSAVKGYGFVVPDDGSADVFLHLSVLRKAGYERLSPGVTVVIEASDGAKGRLAQRIVDLDQSTADPEPADHADHAVHRDHLPEYSDVSGELVPATVKWFNPHKGYGFVCPNDTQADVFVHKIALRRAGLSRLMTGQAVRVRIAEGPKGLQAAEIVLV